MSRKKIEDALKNWQDKLAHYEYELSITASTESKFELRKRIEECRQKMEELKSDLASTDSYQSQSQPSTHSSQDIQGEHKQPSIQTEGGNYNESIGKDYIQGNFVSIDKRSGGVYSGSGSVVVNGDVVGGNQIKNT